MKIERWTSDKNEQQRLLARAPLMADPALPSLVQAILDDIKQRGDEAVSACCEKFDRVKQTSFRVPEATLQKAFEQLDPTMRAALETAKNNISAFHEAQRPDTVVVETTKGVRCEMVWRAIDSVGIYVPGGTAPLLSTVLMLAIPAVLAGCQQIIMCSPPQKDGQVNPETLAAAWLCGVREVYALGGIQAIGAMAYGTAQVPKVCKILGPGNAYVTMAKQLVSQNTEGVAIDMPAGPSEVMVIADGSARADWVAADLLAQAEHDVAAQAILLTTDEAFAKRVQAAVMEQAKTLPRQATIEKSLENSRIILVASKEQAIDIANIYAPEHLILSNEDSDKWVVQLRNAGSIFVGPYAAETGGDYASGTNHVLPTYGAARAYSGVSLQSFLRSMTIQTVTQAGLQALAPTLVQLATAEGLAAHAAAVTRRLNETTQEAR